MKIHLRVDILREIVSMKSQDSVTVVKASAVVYDSFVKRLRELSFNPSFRSKAQRVCL